MSKFQVIAFDADDTLWVNEPYFAETERIFASMLEDFLPAHTVNQELFRTEMQNLSAYGYGIKGFTLSMVETAIRITEGRIKSEEIQKIIALGKRLIQRPIELLPGVEEVLQALKPHYRLVMATKGDLLDQERKLQGSGLEPYFHHIEIMSDKQESDYLKLLRHLDIPASDFVMIGNSLKSDVLPVLQIGGHAFHVPYHTTWAHEHLAHELDHPQAREVQALSEVLPFLLNASLAS